VHARGALTCGVCGHTFTPDVSFLDWLEEPDLQRSHVLNKPRMVVGRGQTCDIIVASHTASREHFQLLESDDGWYAQDLNSSCGTFWRRDGRDLPRLRCLGARPDKLESGDILRPGTQLVRFWSAPFPHVRAHHAPLDVAATNPAAWHVWADLLLEQEDPLGLWLVATQRPDVELHAMAAALLTPGSPAAHGEWNEFGFLSRLTLSGSRFLARQDCCDPRRVPATRYLLHLDLRPAPEEVEHCLDRLAQIPLPRSLRSVEVANAPEASLNSLRKSLRVRCPSIESD
jgi:pSer/pThr/pTyr-binding forkhead associated (FHA) protein